MRNFAPERSEVSHICTLMNSFWPNYILFELKKYCGVKFDGAEDWFKIWRKTDLFLQNGMRILLDHIMKNFQVKHGECDSMRNFFICYENQVLLRIISQWGSSLPHFEKTFFFPSVWPRREYTWKLNWKDSLLIYFRKLPGRSLFSRGGIGWWMLSI